jgi:hypothetical protein
MRRPRILHAPYDLAFLLDRRNMDPASGHNSKVRAAVSASEMGTDYAQFARNEFEAEVGGPPDSFQTSSESKEVYQKNGIAQEITCEPSQRYDWSQFTK